DRAFLAAQGIRVLMLGNPAFAIVVQALYECFKHLKDGGALEDLAAQQASADLLRAVNRTEEFVYWQQRYLRPSAAPAFACPLLAPVVRKNIVTRPLLPIYTHDVSGSVAEVDLKVLDAIGLSGETLKMATAFVKCM